ncbi:Predicted ATPase [Luteibacter sp. UNCMF331Sha3.1]|uniref:ATP-binding protein n=1 Tax=Luteibacter sp. UNCMF331Sha3.1 TaxID=1502760 RepID=UPI0008C107D2|nr:winged helix-turn-helix domain-containing protein [Luteibacter sp. UNCMF331Sha3.1]SEN20980.1 Predicted ATPase [Luteibacter sp. UNCMF331Sha3.1]
MVIASDNLRERGADVAFGPFLLAPARRLLLRDGEPVDIGGRAFDMLVALVERPGVVWSKRELIARVWPDVVVEEGSLRFHMTGLRRILGDGEDGGRYISTQVGVGYAFVGAVRRVDDDATRSVPASLHKPEPARLVSNAGDLPTRRRLVGREADVDRILARLSAPILYTVAGAGGAGKTSIALEVGHRLAEAGRIVRFVDLAQVEDPALVPYALAGALHIPVQTDDPLAVVIAHLRDRAIVLFVDNCEHVVDAVSGTLERLREAAPDVTVLATSREPLRAHDECVHWLDALTYPARNVGDSDEILGYSAVQLFLERASASGATSVPDAASLRLVADICRRLDGMALPIELAALRVGSHGIEATHELIGERFSLEWSGRRTAAPRQQTLRATLDWSYDLLTPLERLAFDQLSVFVGPFSVEAAANVLSGEGVQPATFVATLDALSAKGLVAVHRATATGSYRLLEMTRAYARERMALRGESEARSLSRRHAAYFLHRLDGLGETPEEVFRNATWWSCQFGNVRSALEWSLGPQGDTAIGVPLAAVASRVFLRFSLMAECRTWCERARNAMMLPFTGTAVELELQAALGLVLMFTLGNSDAAGVALRRALDLAIALDRKWDQLRILGRLQIYDERLGDFEPSLAWAEQAEELGREIGEPEAIAVAASLAGVARHLLGDQAAARHLLEESLRHGLPSEQSRTIHYGFDHRNRSCIALARTLWLQGHADQARYWVRRAQEEAIALEHPITQCIALIWTLSVHHWTGETDQVEEALATFAALADAHGFRPYIAATEGFRGMLAIGRGDAAEAVQAIRESLARLKAMRYELLTTTFETALVEALLSAGRFGEAAEQVAATIEHCTRTGEGFALPELLRLKALVLARSGDDPEGVESTLRGSLELAARQTSNAWRLRASMDLAAWWAANGSEVEASMLLRSCRDRAVEGLDTADLRRLDAMLGDAGAWNEQGGA